MKMAIDILVIISFLCLLCVFLGMCLLALISDKLSEIIKLLEEIRNTPSVFATKAAPDRDTFYIHYSKDELEKLSK